YCKPQWSLGCLCRSKRDPARGMPGWLKRIVEKVCRGELDHPPPSVATIERRLLLPAARPPFRFFIDPAT
ncbi:hypothetical protein, partial [Mesorhizobium sp. M7A.F.Ca.CA.001.14.1.1]|uniref:hypothetical protein n=1 Tax=Mesorhizobium sp. M7A.F.Ca.CA.001.14.1.1 TaxID=2496706 RepID=UPI0019D460E2